MDPGRADSLKHVRDKLAAHADGSALSQGLKRLSLKQETGIVVRTTVPQRFRALFLDDVVSMNWQEKALSSQSLDDELLRQDEIRDYSDLISDVRSQTADFVYELFNTYCEEFSLLASHEQFESIQKELQEELDARRKNT